jgi:outer membrane protein
MRPVFLSLAFAAFGFAQSTLQLSLGRAVDIALSPEGSTKIALAQESIVRAQTQAAQSKADLLPSIDGSFQYRNQTVNLRTFGFGFNLPGFTFPSVVGPFSVIDARGSAKWTVLDFANLRRYKTSKAGIDTSRADLEVTRTQVSDQVARAYLATLRADAAVEAAQANVDLSQALTDLAQSQKDAGTGTGIEVTRAKVQLTNDQGQLIFAQSERNRAGLQLLRAIGLEMSVPVQLTDKLSYTPIPGVSVETSLAKANEGRAELKAQRQREQVARLNQSAVDAERLPSVSAFGDYGTIGQPQLGLLPTHQVGVQLSVPVFDGGRRKARRQESSSQVRSEQIRTRDMEQQIELEVRLALNNLRSAETQVTTAREGLDLAQNEVDQARRRYQAGVGVPLEITDAQARLDRARNTNVLALYAHNLAKLDLAVATGTVQEFIQP